MTILSASNLTEETHTNPCRPPYGEFDTARTACIAIYHIISYPGAYTTVLLAMLDRIQPWHAETSVFWLPLRTALSFRTQPCIV